MLLRSTEEWYYTSKCISTTNANVNKSISNSSRNFADAVEARIISLVRNEELALVA